MCRLTRLVETSSSSSTLGQLSARLASLRTTLATALPPRVLLPIFTKCYSSLVVDRKVREAAHTDTRHTTRILTCEGRVPQAQLGALMSILEEHLAHTDRDLIAVHQAELTAFFLSALDFRAEHCQVDEPDALEKPLWQH